MKPRKAAILLRSVASDGRRSWGPYQLLVPVGSPARGALNQPCPPDRRNPGTAWNNWTASGEASALGLLPLLHASYYCIAVTARGPGPALALVTVPRRGRGRGRSERSGPAPGRSGGGVPAIPALTRPLRPGPRGWGCGEGGRRGRRPGGRGEAGGGASSFPGWSNPEGWRMEGK